MKPSESWDDIFMNKTSESPIMSMGCIACLKFHVKVIFYVDCKHKAAHINQISYKEKVKKVDT